MDYQSRLGRWDVPGPRLGELKSSSGASPLGRYDNVHRDRVRSKRRLLQGSTRLLVLAASVAAITSAQSPDQAGAAKPRDTNSAQDLSGVWNASPPKNVSIPVLIAYYSTFGKGEPEMTPWADALYKAAKPSFGPKSVTMEETNDPVYKCFPPGVPRVYLHPFPLQIVQIPGQVIMLFEYDHMVRHIFTDGRGHPNDLSPTWMGHSIGKWDGDTLVVDTVGLNDKSWLDRVGHPHSEQLHLVERMRRVPLNMLQIDFTIEDAKAYSKPITSTLIFQLKSKWDIMEQSCMDNVSFLEFEKKESAPAN
jgi:hypothetical protein